MSLEIQDKFAGIYARYGSNEKDYRVIPHQINHVFQDWFSAWLYERRGQGLGREYTQGPHPEAVVREMFGKFFKSLKERNHVHVPKRVREASIQEYLED
jgi:hypothetical protein